MTALLTAEGLAIARGDRLLCRGLGFALAAGDCLLVEGANGAGKTSLLRVLAGLAPAEAGELRWRGRALAAAGQAFRAELAWFGHRPGLKLDLTIDENLDAAAALVAGSPAGRPAVLERLGIAALRGLPLRVLSAGQQRRVALARLLATRAPLWLLDEPYTNLDRAGQSLVDELLGEHLAGGGLCVLASHRGTGEHLPAQRLVLS